MKKLDLIIDALQQAYEDTPGWCDAVNEALYAARELKALKPVAWKSKNRGLYTVEPPASLMPIPLYALDDEVTK
jgi:hypothetical protein